MLAAEFETFPNICLETYELNRARFLTEAGLDWQSALKNTKVNLDLSTDFNKLLMVEKGIRGRKFNAIHRYAKTNNKYTKGFDSWVFN